MRIVAASPAALELGIMPGLALADARARLPGLAVHDSDPLADRVLIERIADHCDRYSPLVAIVGGQGIVMDVTGCTHLHGSEDALTADVEARLGRWPLRLRARSGDTPEAAQALARFHSGPVTREHDAIRQLPVAALELDVENERALKRAGLKTIGALACRPRAPIAARFGEEVTARLARLLGEADSRLVPRRTMPALVCDRPFAEPVARTDAMLAGIHSLIGEAAAELGRRGIGGRRFCIRLYRSDGVTRDLDVESSLPTRDPERVMRLLGDRMDSLADPIDPGFGFDLIRLAVPQVEHMGPAQLGLEGAAQNEDALATLIDRLSARFGRARIRRFVPVDTHIPEKSVRALPVADHPRPAHWPPPAFGDPPARPIHLFDPPRRVEVVAEAPNGPPRRFYWQRTFYEVKRSEGPERIAPEWWQSGTVGAAAGAAARDYFRVEDIGGRRFWLFRKGAKGTDDPLWYLHGIFA